MGQGGLFGENDMTSYMKVLRTYSILSPVQRKPFGNHYFSSNFSLLVLGNQFALHPLQIFSAYLLLSSLVTMSPRQSLETSSQAVTIVLDKGTKSSEETAIVVTESISDASDSYPREATLDEIEKLRHVAEGVTGEVWLVACIGAAQRLAFYATTVPWQNYLQNPPDNPLSPGALGLGQSMATIINSAFLCLSYLTPLPFAIISDTWLGRYKTLLLSLLTFVVGQVVLFITALPFAIKNQKTALAGIITAMVLIALGQGGTSAVIFPFLGDQIPESKSRVIRYKNGERVVTDRKMTVQFVFSTFYWMINIAALFVLATTQMEKKIGFWAAYLLPLCCLGASIVPFVFWNQRLTKLPPEGTVLADTSKVLILAARSNLHLSAANPSIQKQHHNRSVPWTSTFVDEVRRGFRACRVIICFTIFYLCFNQTMNNIISQANQMELDGISNDTVQSLNAIFYIFLNPLIQQGLFGFLSRHRIVLGPISRMAVAFIFMAAAMAYAAGVQEVIYNRGPCFSHPKACEAGIVWRDATTIHYQPNEISVWMQIPFHILLATSEIFGFVALNEFAYTEAPTNMKALVKAFEQCTAGLGAALGIALGPVSKDPWLVIMYSSLAGTMACSGIAFYGFFRNLDAQWYSTRKNRNEEEPEKHEAVEQE
ncbi:unnamed protein product [Periconia digitata]|uniref:Oligopeptide transporter n=1 Tax=Periconia digitata TaxID=1303443 RepID=A0A9W4UVR4_9PLEO|nr:unnamed protein product [Periconia digitata]